ncbi:MAG TPA: PepSY domain-containing protein [Burkholderiaceae bacterium]
MSRPPISIEDARRIAGDLARQRGWPFLEPVDVHLRRPWLFGTARWRVFSNAECRGQNVAVEIDAETGDILSCGYGMR